ncbi:MAG TPA: DNA translocase FtsK [Chloroflexota bacterium]
MIELRDRAPYILGGVLLGLAVGGLVSLLFPNTIPTRWLARLSDFLFGWLAGAALAWIGALGLALLSQQMLPPGGWLWRRVGGAGAVVLAVLVADALDSTRPAGFIGRGLAVWLQAHLGGWPTVLAALLLILAGATVAVGLTLGAYRSAGAFLIRWTGRVIHWTRNHALPTVARWIRWITKLRGSPSPDLTSHEPSAGPVASPVAPPAPGWKTPPVGLLSNRRAPQPVESHLRDQARVIEETLASFGIEAHVKEINQGPAVTQYGLEPALGVPVSRITSRLNDLALRLGASPIRIEAPVPGRRMMGIEVPNNNVAVVGLREILESEAFAKSKAQIPLALGRDIAGKAMVADLARMPHLLIAGATGSGKSVCLNSLVACMLSQFNPDQLQFIMIDPKMVELVSYNGIPHLRMPVVTEMDHIVGTLKWVSQEMERRYKLFAAHTVRNIDAFNQLARTHGKEQPLPYLVLIIDELADLMMTAPEEAEKQICRLAQLARATGIHLVVATQRPSVDVVTGLIKANFPSRIAFAVTSQVDSRVILDGVGAERLLGRGDMLFMPPDSSKTIRVQGTFVSEEEIEALVNYWQGLGAPQYDYHDLEEVVTLGKPAEDNGDELYDRAVVLAQSSGKISVSFLQRRLGIGYPRAARLVDLLEERGIIAAAEDGRGREVVVQGELPRPD